MKQIITILILLFFILQIPATLVTGIYLQDQTKNLKKEMNQIISRKITLKSAQKKLIQTIELLNQTVIDEQDKQQELSKILELLASQKPKLQELKTAKPVAPKLAMITPAPRRTRAS